MEWNDATSSLLSAFLADPEQNKLAYDWKGMWHKLRLVSADLHGVTADVLLSAYVVGESGKFDIETLCETHLGRPFLGGNLAENTAALFPIHEALEETIQAIAEKQSGKHTIRTVLEEIELPLVPVLFAM